MAQASGNLGPSISVNIGLTMEQKKNMELLISYMATTPKNINYQIIREAIEALVLNNSYNWEALSTTKSLPPKTPDPGTSTEEAK